MRVWRCYHRWLGKDGAVHSCLTTPLGSLSTPCSVSWTEHPQLLLAPRWTNKALRHTDRALFRSACRLQVHSTVGSWRCSNPVQSCWTSAYSCAPFRTRRGNSGQAVTELRAGATTIDDCWRVHASTALKVPRGVGSRLLWTASGLFCASSQSRQGQHGSRCLLARTGRATPEQPWRCFDGWQCARRPHHPLTGGATTPGVLRGFARRTTHSPIIHQSTNGLGTKWVAKLGTLDANHDAEHPIATSGRDGLSTPAPGFLNCPFRGAGYVLEPTQGAQTSEPTCLHPGLSGHSHCFQRHPSATADSAARSIISASLAHCSRCSSVGGVCACTTSGWSSGRSLQTQRQSGWQGA